MRRHIFFDLDGTLTHSAPGILNSLRHAFAAFGPVPSGEALRSCIGPPLRESFARLLSPGADVEKAVTLYRAYFSERGLFENSVYPGIPAMLQRLSAQASLYLATSKPEVFAVRIMDHFALSPFFSGLHGADLNGPRHDKADVLRRRSGCFCRKRWNGCCAAVGCDRSGCKKGNPRRGSPFVKKPSGLQVRSCR